MREHLNAVKEWAGERLRSGAEAPWTCYRLMQLLDALEHLEDGPLSDAKLEHLLQSSEHQENGRPQGACIVPLDSVRRHLDTEPAPTPT